MRVLRKAEITLTLSFLPQPPLGASCARANQNLRKPINCNACSRLFRIFQRHGHERYRLPDRIPRDLHAVSRGEFGHSIYCQLEESEIGAAIADEDTIWCISHMRELARL